MKHFKNTNNEIFAYNDKQVAQGYGANLEPLTDADLAALREAQKQERAIEMEEWKRNRLTEYPNHNDCIHALLDGGDTLTDLQAKRQATKLKFPKP